jgi:cytochrome c biogenesis protein CcdA
LALAAGLSASFTAVGLFVTSLGLALDFDGGTIRYSAAIMMILFGLILTFPIFERPFVRLAGSMSTHAANLANDLSGKTLGGQFVLGSVLGAAWSPCAGPSLGAAIGLASQTGTLVSAGLVMAAFSLGATVPLVLLAYGSRGLIRHSQSGLAKLAKLGKPIMGCVLLALGFLLLSGFDRNLETFLTAAMPPWLVQFTTRF